MKKFINSGQFKRGHIPWNEGTKKQYKCIDCGNEISYSNYRYGKKRCKSCAAKERYKIPENNPNFKDGRYIRPNFCIDCGKEIKNKYSEFCKSCTELGERNHQYIMGKSKEPYSIEFTEKLKESIRKRDNYECQNCNITEEEHLIVYGKVLHVHHIDYNKQNCNENNLISTCQGCNTRANSNRNYWQEFYKNKIKETINA
jgi:5-methylcytosine-specific restriction endonuclease McrA